MVFPGGHVRMAGGCHCSHSPGNHGVSLLAAELFLSAQSEGNVFNATKHAMRPDNACSEHAFPCGYGSLEARSNSRKTREPQGESGGLCAGLSRPAWACFWS